MRQPTDRTVSILDPHLCIFCYYLIHQQLFLNPLLGKTTWWCKALSFFYRWYVSNIWRCFHDLNLLRCLLHLLIDSFATGSLIHILFIYKPLVFHRKVFLFSSPDQIVPFLLRQLFSISTSLFFKIKDYITIINY